MDFALQIAQHQLDEGLGQREPRLQSALDTFRNSDGWEAGVDGSVALVEFGAAGEISSNSAQEPIIGFIFSNKGLMYNLTFEGSKMTRLDR